MPQEWYALMILLRQVLCHSSVALLLLVESAKQTAGVKMKTLPGWVNPRGEKEQIQPAAHNKTLSIWTVNSDVLLDFASDRKKLQSVAVTTPPAVFTIRTDVKPDISLDQTTSYGDKEEIDGKKSAQNNLKAEEKR